MTMSRKLQTFGPGSAQSGYRAATAPLDDGEPAADPPHPSATMISDQDNRKDTPMATSITGDLVRELVDSPATEPAIVCYHSDGVYGVRSTIRDANGFQPGNGYTVVATKDGLTSYLDGFEFAAADADAIAAEWQAK